MSEVNTKKLLTDPLDDNNPITVQVLGVCSALAVSGSLKNALVMAVAVTFVTAFSNLTISLLRNYIPSRIRMIVQLVVIAFLVTLVSISLKAFLFDLSKELSVYVGLIITNCIIMGRLEAFAIGNKPVDSFLDGVGNGIGYGLILVIVGFIRELFGTGALLGFTFFGEEARHGIEFLKHGFFNDFFHNGLMVLPISSIFILGILIWIQRSRNAELIDIS
ncbi:NADH:ubiquinone reductase (Na(+)-transporting) subunit D [Chitinophagales bacterium]|jgi:Na+-transporting NADH:ubiquinone oxidoreductase subunit D|nr:NADH:ubiquinone reductase (Na(+)-transporting) subunit D [Chitinophagales bacterium]